MVLTEISQSTEMHGVIWNLKKKKKNSAVVWRIDLPEKESKWGEQMSEGKSEVEVGRCLKDMLRKHLATQAWGLGKK